MGYTVSMDATNKGRFPPGHSGRPRGTRNRRSADEVLRRAIARTLDEDELADLLEELKRTDPAEFVRLCSELSRPAAPLLPVLPGAIQ